MQFGSTWWYKKCIHLQIGWFINFYLQVFLPSVFLVNRSVNKDRSFFDSTLSMEKCVASLYKGPACSWTQLILGDAIQKISPVNTREQPFFKYPKSLWMFQMVNKKTQFYWWANYKLYCHFPVKHNSPDVLSFAILPLSPEIDRDVLVIRLIAYIS